MGLFFKSYLPFINKLVPSFYMEIPQNFAFLLITMQRFTYRILQFDRTIYKGVSGVLFDLKYFIKKRMGSGGGETFVILCQK